MDFDWLDPAFDPHKILLKDIEESFEDPFGLRLLPDAELAPDEARYFNLGKSISDHAVFSVFWSDGKRYRVIFARYMTPEELTFYERKKSEMV